MGSRAVVLVCRDSDAARNRFGATAAPEPSTPAPGGRSSTPDAHRGTARRVRAAITTAGLWDELDTDWLLLDCELLPWSAKAEELLREQYAAVGAAAGPRCPAPSPSWSAAAARGLDVADLLARSRSRAANADAFTAAYRRYGWPVDGLDGITARAVPGAGRRGRGVADAITAGTWMLADRLVAAAPGLFRPTRRFLVDPPTETRRGGRAWWEELTGAGGEGMVVKPFANLSATTRGSPSPGIKVPGREYLRIIYGPTTPSPATWTAPRAVAAAQAIARAARVRAGARGTGPVGEGEPLWRVHEACSRSSRWNPSRSTRGCEAESDAAAPAR